jgi:hypothetical protein
VFRLLSEKSVSVERDSPSRRGGKKKEEGIEAVFLSNTHSFPFMF